MNENFLFIPKYVKQKSDMEYGSVVTHENYNEKLNLNMAQGDYNTSVLNLLFNEKDITKVYRIPYLEKYVDDTVQDLRDTFTDQQAQIDTNKHNIDVNKTAIERVDERASNNSKAITQIIDGTTKVAKAIVADNLTGALTAGNHKYYGTDYEGVVGYHEVPDSIYLEDIGSISPDISGIYFTPRENSVAENMLTTAVRDKLNRASITRYPELSELPSINGTTLTGNKTLADLGIQGVGNYITEIPDSYATKNFVTNLTDPLLSREHAATTYATITALQNLDGKVDQKVEEANATYPRIFVGSLPEGYSPKTGDLLVTI